MFPVEMGVFRFGRQGLMVGGFGIKRFDLLNLRVRRNVGVYLIELIIDSMTVFKYVMDSFSLVNRDISTVISIMKHT